jgi:hypothetical protein
MTAPPRQQPSAMLTVRVCQAIAERAAWRRGAERRREEAARQRRAHMTEMLRNSGALTFRAAAIVRDREAG